MTPTSCTKDKDGHVVYGWCTNAGWFVQEWRNPYVLLPLGQLVGLLPWFWRYGRYWYKMWKAGEMPFINSFLPLELQPIYGVSCGGIGCGSIGRGYRGEFCRFSIRPGIVDHEVVDADQFILTIRRGGRTVLQQALSAGHKPKYPTLSAWNFELNPGCIEYRGLYPRSWTTYSFPTYGLRLTVRQVSPVFPHEYKDTTLPVSVFVWTISRDKLCPDDDELDISLTFAFRNGIGLRAFDAKGQCRSRPFADGVVRGVVLDQAIDGMACSYTLGVDAQESVVGISHQSKFDPTGSGQELWSDLLDDGQLNDAGSVKEAVAELGIALCAKVRGLKPGDSREIRFCLAWDSPVVSFPGKRRTYKRRYTRWFPDDSTAGPSLCAYAFKHVDEWERKIEAWQHPVLSSKLLPSWYKSALFNELYFLTDGGTTWVEFDPAWRDDEPHMSDYSAKLMGDVGRFAFLESFEYRMFNTYDVFFYASFALAQLWPKLEHCLQAEFCDSVFAVNARRVVSHYDGEVATTKLYGRVPHDLGNPAQEPWLEINAYEMHNTARWRDLNLKFILQSYRDYLLLDKDVNFLKHVWPAVEELLEVGRSEWDEDQDGLIENSNTCDQTYDAWSMHGVSAYCGSLWLAALAFGAEMARILGHDARAKEYLEILNRAKLAFEKKLWTGSYYKFDEKSACHNSVMADQLCGYWYAAMCDHTAELLPKSRVLEALQTVFSYNVAAFNDGHMGAVNGMRPDKTVDRTSMQSEEVWTGVSYALSSFFLREGLMEQAFQTAEGVYRTCFERLGLQYQTPEAYYAKHWYRAVGYMRPLAIWAMQWVLERHLAFPEIPQDVARVLGGLHRNV